MSINVAAAAALLTPVATPVNLIAMGAAGYKFGDYWKLGLLVMAVFFVVSVLIVPLASAVLIARPDAKRRRAQLRDGATRSPARSTSTRRSVIAFVGGLPVLSSRASWDPITMSETSSPSTSSRRPAAAASRS